MLLANLSILPPQSRPPAPAGSVYHRWPKLEIWTSALLRNIRKYKTIGMRMDLTKNHLSSLKLCVSSFFCGLWPGGGGLLNKFLYGEALPWGPTPYPFIYHFLQKRHPFHILLASIDKWYPFRIMYFFQNFASLLTSVNALSFKYESITKIEHFPDFIKP